MNVERCWLIVSFIMVFTNLVNGLKCFECTLSDINCANPISNNVSIVNCRLSIFTIHPENLQSRLKGIFEEANFQCLTTIERMSGKLYYTRRCALKSEKTICDHISMMDKESRMEKCSLCEKDYCNSSTSLTLSSVYFQLLCLIFMYK
ncbi:uncharacterized protein LOC130893967 [Diorhabda carinulata]|uniref:uncharacterized protein LOC130893967 n=1 Tax=Diorhabda carinulata TaxID=1163345 RepID=UPI0025A00E4C|nr:uncharacterized protein LOC130893967 [Diorhabda carinulata]